MIACCVSVFCVFCNGIKMKRLIRTKRCLREEYLADWRGRLLLYMNDYTNYYQYYYEYYYCYYYSSHYARLLSETQKSYSFSCANGVTSCQSASDAVSDHVSR